MDNISIIIRCRNEESYIGLSIQSILDHFKNPEIIIIDNQSTDESMKVVSLFDRCDIKKYSLNGNYTPGKALNFGAKKATNNTLLVTTDNRLAFGDNGEYISGDGVDLKIVSSRDIDKS